MEHEFSLIEIAFILYKRIVFILIIMLVFLCLAFFYIKKQPRIYQSSARILSLSQAGLQLNSLASLAFGGATVSSKITRFNTFLSTKYMAQKVALNYRDELTKSYYILNKIVPTPETTPPRIDDLAAMLIAGLKMLPDKMDTEVLEIKMQLPDAQLCQKIVLMYLDELKQYINENELTVTQRNNTFIGTQLRKNKKQLFEEGKAISKFYDTFKLESNRSVIDVNLAKPMASTSSLAGDREEQHANTLTGEKWVRDVPVDIFLKYLSVRAKVLEEIYGQLETQYQVSKIDAENEKLNFHVIEVPVVNEGAVKPNKALIYAIAVGLGIMVSLIVSFGLELTSRNWSKWKNQYKELGAS